MVTAGFNGTVLSVFAGSDSLLPPFLERVKVRARSQYQDFLKLLGMYAQGVMADPNLEQVVITLRIYRSDVFSFIFPFSAVLSLVYPFLPLIFLTFLFPYIYIFLLIRNTLPLCGATFEDEKSCCLLHLPSFLTVVRISYRK